MSKLFARQRCDDRNPSVRHHAEGFLFVTSGDAFAGKIDSEMGTQELTGKIDGDTLTWSTDITNPMPMTLEFTVKVDGDKMTGKCKLGTFADMTR
jgi:hypothetical protein